MEGREEFTDDQWGAFWEFHYMGWLEIGPEGRLAMAKEFGLLSDEELTGPATVERGTLIIDRAKAKGKEFFFSFLETARRLSPLGQEINKALNYLEGRGAIVREYRGAIEYLSTPEVHERREMTLANMDEQMGCGY